MITLREIRDYAATFGITDDENCYCGMMTDKKEKSIGIYPLKSGRSPDIPVGGLKNRSYDSKPVSVLVHWNESPAETEQAAFLIYQMLQETSGVQLETNRIKFILMSQEEPVPVGTDENGIFEYVIECLIYTERKEE